MQYLTQWQFWLAVIAVALITHWAMGMFLGRRGGNA